MGFDKIFVIRCPGVDPPIYWTDQEPAGWTDLPNATRYKTGDKMPDGEKVSLAKLMY